MPSSREAGRRDASEPLGWPWRVERVSEGGDEDAAPTPWKTSNALESEGEAVAAGSSAITAEAAPAGRTPAPDDRISLGAGSWTVESPAQATACHKSWVGE